MIPLWIKIAVTAFICVLVPVNWRQYGPANFLWFSDLALFLAGAALWFENSLLASMAALAVLLPECAWNIDYFLRLARGKPVFGLSSYMFDPGIPWAIRCVSYFHVWLPILLVWVLFRLGYDPRAFVAQTLLALAVVPLSYASGGPKMNVNWAYGFGDDPQTIMPPRIYLLVVMALFPLVIYLPTHLLLERIVPVIK